MFVYLLYNGNIDNEYNKIFIKVVNDKYKERVLAQKKFLTDLQCRYEDMYYNGLDRF